MGTTCENPQVYACIVHAVLVTTGTLLAILLVLLMGHSSLLGWFSSVSYYQPWWWCTGLKRRQEFHGPSTMLVQMKQPEYIVCC